MKIYAKALVNIVLALVVLLGVIFLVPRLLLFFAPFVAGWIIAMLAAPVVRFFEDKLKLKRHIGGAFVICLVIGLVVLLLYLVISQLVIQLSGWISTLPATWKNLEADIININNELTRFIRKLPFKIDIDLSKFGSEIASYLSDFFGKLGTPTIEAAGNFAKSIPSVIMGVFMALLSSYFFVADRNSIYQWFATHTPKGIQTRYVKIRDSLIHSVGGYFKAQFKIEIWIYILLVIGLAVLKVDYFALIALGIAFLDFLPVFGSGAVLWPWAVIRLFTADYKMAIGLMIIWGIGQLVRQLIQPKIVGDSVGVAPLPTLFLLYVGYRIGGMVGMIIAVPLGIVLFTMNDEGAFDTVKKSVQIIADGINRFRKLEDEESQETKTE